MTAAASGGYATARIWSTAGAARGGARADIFRTIHNLFFLCVHDQI